jgi:hypothetical protein
MTRIKGKLRGDDQGTVLVARVIQGIMCINLKIYRACVTWVSKVGLQTLVAG